MSKAREEAEEFLEDNKSVRDGDYFYEIDGVEAAGHIENLLTELDQYQKVVDAAENFIQTNVSDWKAQDVAYAEYEKLLSQIKDKQ